MFGKLIIEESEKKQIKKLYGLDESSSNTFLMDIIKKSLEMNKDDSPSSTSSNTTKSETPTDKTTIPNKFVKLLSNFNSEQLSVIKILFEEMMKMGIKNPFAQIGILSVIDKESGFKSFKEMGYGGTSDSRIESIFGKRGTKCKHLKKNNPAFFDCVYGYKSGAKLGNDQPGDGWKYVGRGLNGLTGKDNYRRYGNIIGVDLVSNPEQLEDPRISAKVAIAFFTKGKPASSFPNFKTKEEAVNYFADLNAGRSNSSFGRREAMASSMKFDIN